MSETITILPPFTYYLGHATQFPIWDNHPNPIPADPAYIEAVWVSGFGNKDFLTRAECVAIRTKTGMRLPRWLMKDPARRLERGKYYCPEIIDTTPAQSAAATSTENQNA